MTIHRSLLFVVSLLLSLAAQADRITVAAAADLKYALDEITRAFKAAHPGDEVTVIYGSSGKFHTQIQNGAPYDLFFSADIKYPQELVKQGLAASAAKTYAYGRIVLWSATLDARGMTLASLTRPDIARIAIANPRHAPYGQRAEEALRATGLWDQLTPKLVQGENIAQTAQFVYSGNAQAGIIALSLALSPSLASKGGYWLIPEHLHQPLEQGYIITRRAESSGLARRFAAYMSDKHARTVMAKYGFALPGE